MKGEAAEALIGRTIADKYRVLSRVGTGAMGAVYKARQTALDKIVALKVMHAELAADPAFAARFHREAKAASRLDHPNSVRVLDFGDDQDGTLYIAMEFLEGKDLLALMRQTWPIPGDRIIDLLMQTLSALSVAHEQGIVHRDLKPENIMITTTVDDEGKTSDLVKVCDFGIAKLTNDRSVAGATLTSTAKGPLTSAGSLVGTPEYMSPEQGKGDALDARSDLYSVGVILFHMLTGRVPFSAENSIGIILKHITDDPPRPTSIAPHVDPRLEAICLKAMRKRREERYASAREMRADLRAVREQVRGPLPSMSNLDAPPLQASTAATVNDLHPAAGSVPNLEPRRSAAGTEIVSVSTPPVKRRSGVARVAFTSVAVGVAAALAVLFTISRRPATNDATSASAASATPSALTAPPAVALEPLAPAGTVPSTATGGASPPHDVAPTSAHSAHSSHSGGSSAPSPTPPTPRGVAAMPSPSVAVVAAAPAAAPPPVAAPTPPPASTGDEPAYDPSNATVDVGSVNPTNVNGDAVRAAMRGAPLTRCYRDALRARGRRAFGSASVTLSIDETGRVTGAVLMGADWLPEMSRCIQGSTMGLQLRPGAAEAGGGTAEVWLSFRAP